MRSRKLNMIGLIVPDMEGPYSFEIIKGVNRAIVNSEYDLLVYTTGDFKKADTQAHEQHYVSLLNGTITDGVLLVTPQFSEFSTKAPIVSIDPSVVNANFPAILATSYTGAVDAMKYLISLNHRKIGFITGRPGIQTTERLKAYLDCLETCGIPFEPDLVVEGDFSTKTGLLAGKKLLQLPDRPTAIFASNDQTAFGVLQSAKELGIRVPEDLSVIGFDNISEAEYLELTTVDQSLARMGIMATEMLISLINNQELDNNVITLPTKLVVRKSCRAI
jgi:LacI family transcriptional regulator